MPTEKTAKPPRKDEVDEASEESFPASDPPSNQPIHPGPPGHHPDKQKDPPKRNA
jgi:hypothetical protein